MLNAKEAGVLQDLARQYMELAARPQQRELEKLWISHNTGSGVRPMVLVDQIPWHEMDVDGSLTTVIADPYWKEVETALRQTLYKMRFIPSDLVLPPYILLPRVLKDPFFRGFGIKIQENIARTDVRKVSCSPWSDPNRFAAALPQHLVMSFKANPAFIGAGDMDAMRENLQGAIDAAR